MLSFDEIVAKQDNRLLHFGESFMGRGLRAARDSFPSLLQQAHGNIDVEIKLV